MPNRILWWTLDSAVAQVGTSPLTDTGVSFQAGIWGNGAYSTDDAYYLEVANNEWDATTNKFTLSFGLITDFAVTNGKPACWWATSGVKAIRPQMPFEKRSRS